MVLDFILFFTIYSLVGWVMETAFKSITERKFVNRGFLHGPFTPIYGFGALLIIVSSRWIENILGSDSISLSLSILSSIFLVTALEFITGFMLEKVFREKWWDYSQNAFNLKGYICIKYSLLWGMLAFLLIQVVHPIVNQVISSISMSMKGFLAAFFVAYFAIDTYKSVVNTLGLRKVILNYSDFPLEKYREKVIKYKRIFHAFPRLLSLNEGILQRDVRSILNNHLNRVKEEIEKVVERRERNKEGK